MRMEHHIKHIEELLENEKLSYPKQWTAIKIVEGDKHITENLKTAGLSQKTKDEIEEFYKFHSSDSFELEIVDSRYAYANKVAKQAVRRPDEEIVTLTDKIDRLLIHKYLGIPVFAAIMLVVFQLTFAIGEDLWEALLPTWLKIWVIVGNLCSCECPTVVSLFNH